MDAYHVGPGLKSQETRYINIQLRSIKSQGVMCQKIKSLVQSRMEGEGDRLSQNCAVLAGNKPTISGILTKYLDRSLQYTYKVSSI